MSQQHIAELPFAVRKRHPPLRLGHHIPAIKLGNDSRFELRRPMAHLLEHLLTFGQHQREIARLHHPRSIRTGNEKWVTESRGKRCNIVLVAGVFEGAQKILDSLCVFH
jgi:hypothetical protein